jgi:hypothetical protein
MQARHPSRTVRRPGREERGFLDQKSLTYLLTFILILLIVVFVVCWKYQDWVIQQAKWIVQYGKLAFGIE